MQNLVIFSKLLYPKGITVQSDPDYCQYSQNSSSSFGQDPAVIFGFYLSSIIQRRIFFSFEELEVFI